MFFLYVLEKCHHSYILPICYHERAISLKKYFGILDGPRQHKVTFCLVRKIHLLFLIKNFENAKKAGHLGFKMQQENGH